MEHAISDLQQLPVSGIMGFIEKHHSSHAETLYNNHSGLNLNTAIRFLILADVLSKFSSFKYFLVHTMLLEDAIDIFKGKVPVTTSQFAELYESLPPEALGILLGAAIQAPGALDFDPDVANQLHSKDKEDAIYALIALLGYLMPFDRHDFSKFVEARTEVVFQTTTQSGDYVSARFNNGSVDTLYEFIGSPAAPVLFSPEGKYYGVTYLVETEIQFDEKPIIEGEVEALEILIPNLMSGADLEEAEEAYLKRVALIQALPRNQELDLAKLASIPNNVLAKLGDPSIHPRAFDKLRPVKARSSSAYSIQCRELVENAIQSLDMYVGQYSESFMEIATATVQRLLASMRNLKPADDGHDHTAHFNVVEFMGPAFVEMTGPDIPIKVIESCVDGDTIFVPFDRNYLIEYLKAVGMPYNTKRIKEGALILSLYTALGAHLQQMQLALQAGDLPDDDDDSDEADTESFDGDSDNELSSRDVVALHNLSLAIHVTQNYHDDLSVSMEHGPDLPLNKIPSSVHSIVSDAVSTIRHLSDKLTECESDPRIDKLVELGYKRDLLEDLDPDTADSELNRMLAQHRNK